LNSRRENYDPGARARAGSLREPTLHASSRNNHSLFSFGGYNAADENTTGTYDFLPSPSFDDLQSSIATAPNDFNYDRASNTESNMSAEKRQIEAPNSAATDARASVAGRGPTGPRPARTGSILRRQSTSTRQSSISSTTSGASGAMDPPSAPLALRNRRQSQYPPISGSANANTVKAPRRSIGPGVIDTDNTRTAQRRRPSLASSASAQGLSDIGGASTRVNVGGGPSYTDGARGLTASRAAKTKSLQPPSRQGQINAGLKVGTPEHIRSSSFAGKSPARTNVRGTTTPSSSAKRMSVMPGMPTSTSHATGLGARTVSPTDARRAKRLSILHNAPPMPSTPPTPQPENNAIRTSSRSPSMLPRKVATPSSSRTTPDINNRKSYSSGISITSTTSYNTSRTSTGSLQPRMPPPPSSSRLPTPKPRSIHSSAGNNEEEEVPPVPAIPKAYESPKDSPADPPFFNKRKSSMPFDASSINSTSTNSLSGPGSIREPPKNDREQRIRKVPASNSDQDQQNHATPVKKKNLQPLRLPPLNLLPLSTPTAAKIAALQPEKDPNFVNGQVTPPPRRVATKTPSTPMTASKVSFFSRRKNDSKAEKEIAHMRSSSSIHLLRSESSSQLGGSSSESTKPIVINGRAPRQTVSPFISNSLPKNGGDYSFMPRSKTSGDISSADGTTEPARPARLNGPRAQKMSKIETSQISSPEDQPPTPSSASSLRRKLSLGWKRNTSKSNISISQAAIERDSEYPPHPPKHDNMPPPRLPASATTGSLSNYAVPSPSPSTKSTTYLDSKRRKSSISSLNMFGNHDRTRSDSWGVNGSPKKDSADSKSDRPAPVARTTSTVMQKMLNSKTSTGTMRSVDPWTMDLDKDDMTAEDEMKKLGLKRKETEQAARQLDALRKRATPKTRVSCEEALRHAALNIFERGEIIDFKDVYFCGTADAAKHVGEMRADTVNFGYDDERGDYSIVQGDHLSYRYEIIDVLGKGSFGQVVRCIDHKTGGLVAVKIIRNKKRFHQQALVEVNILQKLREWVSRIAMRNVNYS
jgi:dual specificity tyrosine-phosphorylation-regulated kinase 2/3/4